MSAQVGNALEPCVCKITYQTVYKTILALNVFHFQWQDLKGALDLTCQSQVNHCTEKLLHYVLGHWSKAAVHCRSIWILHEGLEEVFHDIHTRRKTRGGLFNWACSEYWKTSWGCLEVCDVSLIHSLWYEFKDEPLLNSDVFDGS